MPREASKIVRQTFSLWDPDLTGQGRRAIVIIVLVSLLTGLLVTVGLSWSAVSARATQARSPEKASVAMPTSIPPATEAPTSIPTPVGLPLATGPQTPTQMPLPTESPALLVSSPPAPTVAPAPPPAPTAEQAWAAVEPGLDTVWGVDSAASLAILNDFNARFPEYLPAREKLYAALLARAADLVQRGAPADAAPLLARANALAPERAEGRVALQALTPTSTPVVVAQVEAPTVAGAQSSLQTSSTRVTPSQPTAAPTRIAPTPVARPTLSAPPTPQAQVPTPTKVPFRPSTAP